MQNLNHTDSATPTCRIRIVAYWIVTLLVAHELVASAIWVLAGTEYVTANLTHLGYPLYFPSSSGLRYFGAATGYCG